MSRRIEMLALGDQPIAEWMRGHTDQLGADVLVDCSARGAPAATTAEALKGIKRGGIAVNIGALTEPLPIEPDALHDQSAANSADRTGSPRAKAS